MAKKIPNELKRRMLIALGRASEPMPSSFYADVTRDLSPSMHRSATQVTMMLKQLAREHPEIEAVDLQKNGVSATGASRTRKGWFAPTLALDDDDSIVLPDQAPPLKKVSVNLPPDCVAYLETLKDSTGMSPGRVFIDMLRADMAVNTPLDGDDDQQDD